MEELNRLPFRWLLLGASLFLSGCVATSRDVMDMEQQADDIKAQVSELKKTVSSLQANQADLATKMDQMHSDISAFTSTLQDSQNTMGQLSSKMDDLQAVLGQKVSTLGEVISKKQSQLEEQVQQTAATAAQAQKEMEKVEATQKEAVESTMGSTPSQLYRSSKLQLSRKHYALAAQGFETYLKKYPKGEATDASMYYLGEAYYHQKLWENAAREYALVLEKFPKSSLIPAARLKYAMCLIDLKSHLDEARRYLQSIPDDFPQSPDAASARKLLKRLGASAAPSSKGSSRFNSDNSDSQ